MNQGQLNELTAEVAEAKDAGFVTFCIDRKRLESLLARLADLERLREAVEAERKCCRAEKAAMLKRENFDIAAMSVRIQAAEDAVDAALTKLTPTT